ncbi:MAG: 50S ribosomal protein L9 [Bacteroidia bacterium]|jgi:large subunit ribosomal protein L9
MEIILKKDVEHVGFANEIVKVRAGYARNFLVPSGLAVMATDSARKVHAENMRQQAHKAERVLTDAKDLAARLAESNVKVGAKVGSDSEKIFGSINTIMLADSLLKAGISVERRQLKIKEENIRTIGTYRASALLHKEVSVEFDFEVVAE